MTNPVETTDGSLTLFSDRYHETYHSIHGAETESRHIFLEASGVADRLRAKHPTRVLEIGFGLGLNCLLTADLAAQCETRLLFTSVENSLISAADLLALKYQGVLATPNLAHRLVSEFNQHEQNTPNSTVAESLDLELSADIRLKLLSGDCSQMEFEPSEYDAIYLDAFSPAANPECWTLSFVEKLHACLRLGGILTTYSAKGDVRRRLQKVGFSVQKHPGPPGKREFLVAHA